MFVCVYTFYVFFFLSFSIPLFSSSHSGLKYSHKRILLFTNNDNPHRNDDSLQVCVCVRVCACVC